MFERAEKFLYSKPITMMKILDFGSAFCLKSCWFLGKAMADPFSYYYLTFEWCAKIFQSLFPPPLSHLILAFPVLHSAGHYSLARRPRGGHKSEFKPHTCI